MQSTAEETKQHFTELYECVWNKILSEQKWDKRTAASMRQFVANLALTAWNVSLAALPLSQIQIL